MSWILILSIILTLTLVTLVIWLIITIIFASVMLRGAVFVRTRDEQLKTILQLIKEEFGIKLTPPLSPSFKKRGKFSLLEKGPSILLRRGMLMPPVAKAADLGSGDGKILITLAQLGIEAHGYEINPVLVWRSRWNIKKAGLQNKAFVYQRSFWSVDLSSYDLITIYGTTYIMKRLEAKLQRELKPGAIVISNYFKFPDWKPIKSQNQIHLYHITKLSKLIS